MGVNWLQLDSMCTLPKTIFNDHMYWPKHLHVVPEYAFSVEVQGDPLLSSEHSEYRWCDAIQAQKLLKYDFNRIALWELCERLKDQGKRIPELDRFYLLKTTEPSLHLYFYKTFSNRCSGSSPISIIFFSSSTFIVLTTA